MHLMLALQIAPSADSSPGIQVKANFNTNDTRKYNEHTMVNKGTHQVSFELARKLVNLLTISS